MSRPTRAELVDDDLTEAATELLEYDTRFPDLELTVRSRGRVLHLTGELGTAAELAAVRELLGRLAGVLAVWDRIRVGGLAPVVLDLGCGATVQHADNVGVDRRHTDVVSVVADLRSRLPFAEHSVDQVFTVHVLEHLPDFLPLIDECHRVLRPGGVLHVLAPWWGHVNAVADPTHVRLLDVQTVKGICARPDSDRRWYPLHAARDDATVFADLSPLARNDPPPVPQRLARFFD